MIYINKSSRQELDNWLLQNDSGIICYGAGELFSNMDDEIKQKVVDVIDTYKSGAHIVVGNNDLVIKSQIEDVEKEKWKNNCLLITTKYFPEIIAELEDRNIGIDINVFIYPVIEINSLTKEEILNQRLVDVAAMYLSVHDGGNYLENKYSVRKKIEEGKIIIPKIVFLLTNRCTLRCKECTGRIPYMPIYDIQAEQVKRDIDRILELVDEIEVLQLAGGESLLYPNIVEILNYVIEKEKVKTIHFVTNGTIIPREEVLEILSNNKIFLYISDYGFTDKLRKLIDVLSINNIRYVVLDNLKWKSVGPISKRNKSFDQMEWEYWMCDNGKGCKTVLHGKLFACDRCARMYLEEKLNNTEHNYNYESDMIDLEKDDDTVINAIKNLYLRKSILACDYCDYNNVSAVEVVPAEQL